MAPCIRVRVIPTPDNERRGLTVAERRYPWLVVDTWGEKPPVGCWTEAAAKALPGQITAGYEMGRWRAEAAQSDDPESTKTDTLGPDR